MVGRVAQYSPAAGEAQQLRPFVHPSSAPVLGNWSCAAAVQPHQQGGKWCPLRFTACSMVAACCLAGVQGLWPGK